MTGTGIGTMAWRGRAVLRMPSHNSQYSQKGPPHRFLRILRILRRGPRGAGSRPGPRNPDLVGEGGRPFAFTARPGPESCQVHHRERPAGEGEIGRRVQILGPDRARLMRGQVAPIRPADQTGPDSPLDLVCLIIIIIMRHSLWTGIQSRAPSTIRASRPMSPLSDRRGWEGGGYLQRLPGVPSSILQLKRSSIGSNP
jgi:hypothetical protein